MCTYGYMYVCTNTCNVQVVSIEKYMYDKKTHPYVDEVIALTLESDSTRILEPSITNIHVVLLIKILQPP